MILNNLAISFSSELILHLHGSGDGGVYRGAGDGWVSRCSKRMFLILSFKQPAEIN